MMSATSIPKKILIASTIIFFALLLRLPRLTSIEDKIHDEIYYVKGAMTIVGIRGMGKANAHETEPALRKIYDTNYVNPPLAKLLMGSTMLVLGNKPIGWRLNSLLAFLAVMVFCYLICELLWPNTWVSIWTLAFLGIDFLNIVESRLATQEMIMTAFACGGIYFALKFSNLSDGKLFAILSGLFIGMAMLCKVANVIVLAIANLVFVNYYLHNKFSRDRLIRSLIYLNGAAIVAFSFWLFYSQFRGYTVSEFVTYSTTGTYRVFLAPRKFLRSFTSPWEWLFGHGLEWYYFTSTKDYVIGIFNCGNPAIWYLLLPSVTYFLWRRRAKNDFSQDVPLIWFLTTYIALILVLTQRNGYFYHMMIVDPAVCMLVARLVSQFRIRWKIAFGLVAATITCVTLPFLLGIPVSWKYYNFIVNFVRIS